MCAADLPTTHEPPCDSRDRLLTHPFQVVSKRATVLVLNAALAKRYFGPQAEQIEAENDPNRKSDHELLLAKKVTQPAPFEPYAPFPDPPSPWPSLGEGAQDQAQTRGAGAELS